MDNVLLQEETLLFMKSRGLSKEGLGGGVLFPARHIADTPAPAEIPSEAGMAGNSMSTLCTLESFAWTFGIRMKVSSLN